MIRVTQDAYKMQIPRPDLGPRPDLNQILPERDLYIYICSLDI